MQLRKIIWLVFVFCFGHSGFGQIESYCYVVKFTDKNNSAYSLNHPEEFLSAKSIERRIKFNIGFDGYDLPVNESYVNEVQERCHCKIGHRSKWLNTVLLHSENAMELEVISRLPFVQDVQLLSAGMANRNSISFDKLHIDELEESTSDYSDGMYGKGINQIEMLNGHLLHELGYEGQGMDIAVLDAGFTGTEKLPVFEKLRNEGRIEMTRDFALGMGSDIYNWSTHGTSVLSIIASDLKNAMIGTAPKANFFLFRTENVLSETPQEEYNWAVAAELCDSLGIDILNTSLGYSQFDDTTQSYTYADMDGNTTIITRAANIAASKGMLVINSAGNEGDDDWHYITAPADGDSVLAIGATDSLRMHAFFSSYGPSYDGRIKPNVMAMGQMAAYAAQDSTIKRGNGTSFSGPVMTGAAACLWQAFPEKSSMEIFHTIEQSAHLYHNPNDAMGYGIPDFWRAFLSLQNETKSYGDFQVQVFPNPCINYLNIALNSNNATQITYEIYDAMGKKVVNDKAFLASGNVGVLRLDRYIEHLTSGVYSLLIQLDESRSTIKFIKLNEPNNK